MLTIKAKKQFKKDLKNALQNPRKNTDLLKILIDEHLILTGTVPDQYRPHPLIGNWLPCMECHIQNDFLLILDVDWQNQLLILHRCGTHAELFG